MSRARTCLVVDDSSAIRRAVASLFRQFAFDVAEAPTGMHAVEYCRTHSPDVVMLDWNMPVMDGISCLHVLNEIEMPRRPTIIMCTTESQIAKIQEALMAGADEYIMKPFDSDVLFGKLTQLGLV